ncbi:xanthine uracil vitamin c permease [Klebsormidium nitens]|uniref:Xanthine uracil vitamin c permease n=1 Tax=Klebsormidium nitens TaxID=105231 RepID=A0A1Y1HLR3_KLENI|nr:xanthine uracil vitamin c permease [Klebsormidium nitens]|eukprot:GAQ79544.1 xanthine uracil vitamin c permease [Klebsormidium nitens]
MGLSAFENAVVANPVSKQLDKFFHISRRKSSIMAELRAGLTLFMTSAYILFLNPLILSAGGLPKGDVLLATAISTGFATGIMGLVANYPWVCSVQLGTNVYFVYQVIKPGTKPEYCPEGSVIPDGGCDGFEIHYNKALAATVLEGIVFTAIALGGFRSSLMKLFPKTVLMAGAAGIGVFISFVGIKSMGVVVQADPPNLVQLNKQFNRCYNDPSNGPTCPWLSMAGLTLTAILTVYHLNGSLLIGILFTTFISWIKWTDTAPQKAVDAPTFQETAGNISFAWGSDSGKLISAFVTFLYLDFIGACITFYSMGTMMDIIDENGDIPNSNKGFLADGLGTVMGGILGTSCLTTYVESAAAVKEGGRTGLCACFCSVLFFLMCFLSPIFTAIPNIATGPILVLIGVLIFNESIIEIEWKDLTEAIPAFLTIIVQPFTSNIAYGAIAGFGAWIIIKLVTFQLHPWQKTWPGGSWATNYLHVQASRSMKMEMGDDTLPTTESDVAKQPPSPPPKV